MPTAAAETVALLERLHAALPLPRVAALLLPPPAADGSKDGEFGAIELDDGSTGLTFVLLGDTLATLRGGGARLLAGRPAIDVARRYASAHGGAPRATRCSRAAAPTARAASSSPTARPPRASSRTASTT